MTTIYDRGAIHENQTTREIVDVLIPALRKWVDLYDTDPGSWPDDEHDLLSAAHIALNLHESIRR